MALSAAEVLSSDVFNGWKKLCGLEIVEAQLCQRRTRGSVMTMKNSTGHPGVIARRSRADAR